MKSSISYPEEDWMFYVDSTSAVQLQFMYVLIFGALQSFLD